MSVASGQALIAGALMNAPFDELPSPYVVARLAEHVGAASMWQELADRPYLLDTLDPDSVAAAALRTAYGRTALPAAIAASLSARHLLNQLRPPDRLMTRWIAAACGRSAPGDRPRAWANIGDREPAHIVLTGHAGAVLSVAALRAGDELALASSGADATIRIWDPVTGRPARNPLAAAGSAMTAIAGLTSGGGQLLAGVSTGGGVRVWNWQNGAAVTDLAGERSAGEAMITVLPQPGGREFLCTGTDRGALHLWEVGAGGELRPAGSLTPRGHVRSLTALPRPDGSTSLVTAGYDGSVQLWDVATATEAGPVWYYEGGLEWLTGVAAADGSHLLLIADDDDNLDLRTVDEQGQPARATGVRLPRPGPVVATLIRERAGEADFLAVGDQGGLVRLWQSTPTGWQPAAAMAGHSRAVTAMTALSFPDGRTMLVTGSRDATVRLWHPEIELDSGQPADGLVTTCATLRFGGREVLTTGSNRGVVRSWDAGSGRPGPGPRLESPGAVYAIAAIDIDAGQTVIATAGTELVVEMWNLDTGAVLRDPLRHHQSTIHALAAFHDADGRPRIASAGADRTIRLWDPGTGRPVGAPLSGHRGAIRQLAVARPRRGQELLVAAGDEPVVRLWQSDGSDSYHDVAVNFGADVRAIATAGELLLAGCRNGEVHVYDTGGSERQGVIGAAPDDEISALAVVEIPGDVLMVVGTYAGEVQLWSLPARRRLRTTLLPLDQRPEAITVTAGRLVVRTQRGFLGCEIDPRVLGGYQPDGFRFQDGSSRAE